MTDVVAGPKRLDVLFALLGTTPDEPVDGSGLIRRLGRAGVNAGPGSLLSALLRLEESGHVTVQRTPSYAFSLTPRGEEAAHDLGPGARVDATVLMLDLVGFVAFTEEHGDDEAHRAALVLHDAADAELRSRSGRVVKSLGDGVLGTLPPGADTEGAVVAIAQRCARPDGSRWEVRAGAREGRPIAFGGDLYGADVNLVARLCDAARPDELVLAVGPAVPVTERLEVRGLAQPVSIRRVPVP
jgi:class 3 adenylate cyclase